MPMGFPARFSPTTPTLAPMFVPGPESLERVELNDPGQPLPPEVETLLATADQCILDHLDRVGSPPSPGFLACDHDVSWRALHAIRDRELSPGPRFCEWGSGFGVVTLLAAGLGYEAHGIEIHPHLVQEAEALADRLGLATRYGVGNFVPPGTRLPPDVQAFTILSEEDTPDGHAALGRSMADFDLIHVYIWPDEEEIVHRVFAQHSRPGALLLTYHGEDWVELWRRLPDQAPSSSLRSP